MNRDLQFRFRLATLAGVGAALATWLLTGYLAFDGEDSIGTAAAGGLAFGLVTSAILVAFYVVPREWRVLETVFSVAARSARTRREAYGDGACRQRRARRKHGCSGSRRTRPRRVGLGCGRTSSWGTWCQPAASPARCRTSRPPIASTAPRPRRSCGSSRVASRGIADLRRHAAELDGDERRQAEIDVALLEALVAAANGGDWRAPVLSIRDRVERVTWLVGLRWFLPLGGMIAVGAVLMTLVAYAYSIIV